MGVNLDHCNFVAVMALQSTQALRPFMSLKANDDIHSLAAILQYYYTLLVYESYPSEFEFSVGVCSSFDVQCRGTLSSESLRFGYWKFWDVRSSKFWLRPNTTS